MKIIAVPVEGDILCNHFGGAPAFRFYYIQNGILEKKEDKTPPPHEPGVIPRWIASQSVTDIILGGVGANAVRILQSAGINVVKGVAVSGSDEIVTKFLEGTLTASEEECSHDHHHHHGDHSHHHHHRN